MYFLCLKADLQIQVLLTEEQPPEKVMKTNTWKQHLEVSRYFPAYNHANRFMRGALSETFQTISQKVII